MIRRLIRLFLFLCFLLLRGDLHLYAHAYYNTNSYTTANIPETSLHASYCPIQDLELHISVVPSSDAENVSDKIKATEIEDEDESESFHCRKLLEVTNDCTASYYAQASGYVQRYLQNRLPFCRHFSYSSSYKFIVHRAIRI